MASPGGVVVISSSHHFQEPKGRFNPVSSPDVEVELLELLDVEPEGVEVGPPVPARSAYAS